MRILIFGAGVIGSLYGALLAEAEYDVSVYARGRRLERLTQGGLLYKRKGKIRKAPVSILSRPEAEDRYDFVFLTVRDNLGAIAVRKIRLSPGKMQAFRLLPTPLVGRILGFVFQSSFGDRFMYRHSMKAPDEMRQLHEQFYRWLEQESKKSI